MNISAEQLESFFKWGTIINLLLLTFSFLIITIFRKFICRLHAGIFKVDEDFIAKALYCFIGFWKVLIFEIFIIPWIVILIIN